MPDPPAAVGIVWASQDTPAAARSLPAPTCPSCPFSDCPCQFAAPRRSLQCWRTSSRPGKMPPPFFSKRRHGRDQVGAVLCPNGIRQSRCRVPSAVHTPRQGTQGYTSCDISFDLCHRQFVPAAAERGGREPARECASELYRHDALRTPLIGGPGVATAHGVAHAQHLPLDKINICLEELLWACDRIRRAASTSQSLRIPSLVAGVCDARPARTPHNLHSHTCLSLLIRAQARVHRLRPPQRVPHPRSQLRADLHAAGHVSLGPPCEVGPTPPAGRPAREEF